ncbi:MAG TPA: hypothetical protein VJ781_05830 [Pyrinomonadaceae bacterium]|jgi:uncharacterized protein YjbJ (UPF0337 family)|nr:hypothetical protein [Pyrinomonadaceae bacterium]
MQDQEENETSKTDEHKLRDRVSGFGQKVIGEIESIGGILTGDPNTAAEGEFNVEVGTVRSELEETSEGREEAENDETGSETRDV